MNKNTCKILLGLILLVTCLLPVVAQTTGKSGSVVEVSFDYTKMKGFATNQFAIWVEDDSGNFVKTLYVTKFTAKKGYKNRPDALPEWVVKANPAKNGVDAASGSTPKAGSLSYTWNLTDATGKTVKAGNYRICFEATLFWEKQITAFSTVTVSAGGLVSGDGKTGDGALKITTTKKPATQADHDKNDEMIKNIKMRIK